MKIFNTFFFFTFLLFSNALMAHDYTKTKYPVVLVHGLNGFDDIAGIDYFYRLPQILREGGTEVFVARVSAAHSSEVRGEQLLQQVQYILAISNAPKVNLIGHSQGAQTIRYVASVQPNIVASVTSVGGVNWGSKLADVIRATFAEGSILEFLIAKGVNAGANIIEFVTGDLSLPTDSLAVMGSLSTAGSIQFNRDYPEGVPSQYCGEGKPIENGIHYFSWSGSGLITNIFDPSDYNLLSTSVVFDEPSDGLVSTCSSHLGHVIKDDYNLNHLDQVNQMFGIRDLFSKSPISIYRDHVNTLKKLNL